jgi:hypothetical protein
LYLELCLRKRLRMLLNIRGSDLAKCFRNYGNHTCVKEELQSKTMHIYSLYSSEKTLFIDN